MQHTPPHQANGEEQHAATPLKPHHNRLDPQTAPLNPSSGELLCRCPQMRGSRSNPPTSYYSPPSHLTTIMTLPNRPQDLRSPAASLLTYDVVGCWWELDPPNQAINGPQGGA